MFSQPDLINTELVCKLDLLQGLPQRLLLGTAFVPLDDVENTKLHHVSPSASLL